MKNLFTRFLHLFTTFFASFWRTPAPDGQAIDQVNPKNSKTMFENFKSNMGYAPTYRTQKSKKHNNRKRTRGRRFVYVLGKRQAIASNW